MKPTCEGRVYYSTLIPLVLFDCHLQSQRSQRDPLNQSVLFIIVTHSLSQSQRLTHSLTQTISQSVSIIQYQGLPDKIIYNYACFSLTTLLLYLARWCEYANKKRPKNKFLLLFGHMKMPRKYKSHLPTTFKNVHCLSKSSSQCNPFNE